MSAADTDISITRTESSRASTADAAPRLLQVVQDGIARGASPREAASALADLLLDELGMCGFQLWLHDRAAHLELAVARGEESPTAAALAEKTSTKSSTQLRRTDRGGVVSAPIHAAGEVLGVVQISWTEGPPREAVALTEQVRMLLAIALLRQRDVDEKEKAERELNLFYEITRATRFTLNLEHMAQFISGSLHNIVDYDVNALLILDEPCPLHIQTRFPAGQAYIEGVKERILNTLNLTYGIETDKLALRLQTDELPLPQAAAYNPEKPRSFLNVPLTIDGSVAGIVHLSSGRENAFTESDVVFLNRIADFLASSVQGIKDILAMMKGRIEGMVENMADGVLMLDRHGEVVALNRAARTVLRFNPLRERRPHLGELREALEFDPLALMKAERRTLRKVVCVHQVPYQAQLSPVEDPDGQLAGAVMAFRNFTEEQKIDEMKSEFINIVSHELRTPLTAIKNSVSLLLGTRLGELNQKQNRFLDIAKKNIDQLIGMVNDLLDLSKIEEGRMHVELQPLDLVEPLESVVSSLQARAEERGITLELKVEGELPSIYGDISSLERVFVNLIGNAIKFTETGGRVTVEVQAIRDGTERGLAPSARVVVTDTGVGIPEAHLESIFERFAQVDSARRQDVAGTGLGLPIARELIHAHYGRLWAESEPGQGSKFIVLLPQLTEHELLLRSLERDLDRARRLPAPLSLVRVWPSQPTELEALSAENRTALLDRIDKAAQDAIRRSTDRLVSLGQGREVLTVLLDTPREGGRAFAARLAESMEQAVRETGEAVTLSWGFAVFPEDAATAATLYQRVCEPSEKSAGRAGAADSVRQEENENDSEKRRYGP